MDKQNQPSTYSNIYQKNPVTFNPKSTVISKTVIPEKKLSADTINKLFAEVANGNYLKLKQFLLENQLTMTSRNDTDESVLHIIIKNSNISQKEKLQLVELAIQMGAHVNTPDQNNIMPLHIATKLQLFDIVKYLIERGADVKATDNQFKTPLHYAISGDSTECINDNQYLAKPLIPKSAIKKKMVESDVDIKKLQDAIRDLLIKDPDTKKFIMNLSESINDIENMFPFDFKTMENDATKKIIDTIISPSIKGDKNVATYEEAMNMKKILSDYILKQIADGVVPLKIEPNINSGWGPGIYQQNRVLQNKELSEFLDDINVNVTNEITKLNIDFQALIGKLEKRKDTMDKIRDACLKAIEGSHYYCDIIGRNMSQTNLEEMRRSLSMQRMEPIRTTEYLFASNTPDEPIECPIIHFPYFIFPDIEVPGSGNTPIIPLEWDNVNNKFVAERLPNGQLNMIEQITSVKTKILTNNNAVRINKREAERLHNDKKKSDADEIPLSNEVPLITGASLINFVDPNDFSNIQPQTLIVGAREIVNSRGLYFDTKFKVYFYVVVDAQIKLRDIVTKLAKHLERHNYEQAFLAINECINHSLTMALSLSFIYKEIPILHSRLSNLLKFFANKEQYLENKYKFLIEQISEKINNANSQVDKLNGEVENYYGTIRGITKLLNSAYSIIQKSSANEIMGVYFSDVNFDTFYTKQQTNILRENIVDRMIEPIKDFPENMTDFMKLESRFLRETKKTLINEFMPQITLNNLLTFYERTSSVRGKQLPTVGFVQFFVDNTESLTYNPVESLMFYDKTAMGPVYLDNKIKEITPASPTSGFNAPDPNNLLGYVGIDQVDSFNKSNKLPHIIGTNLNVHIRMLRYSIVRWIINKIFDYVQLPDDTKNKAGKNLDQYEKNTKNALDSLISKIKSVVPFDENNYSFVLVLVGRYVDEMLINILYELINKKTNIITLKLLQHADKNIPSNFLDKMHNKPEGKIYAPKADVGFSLDMSNTLDNVMVLYKSRSIGSSKINAITVGNLNDSVKKKSNIVKLINFNFEINSLEQSCFKSNPDIIQFLIKNGAYINSKDAIGNTPIYYAIEMQNKTAIDLLLDNGAIVYNQNFKNKLGKNALDFAWENYCNIVQTLMTNKYKVCETLTNNLLDKFAKKGEYKNNVPRYSDILLPMCLYLLNHQLYINGIGYSNGWSFELNNKLEQLLKLNKGSVLPMLEIDVSDTDISKMEIPNMQIEKLKTQINDEIAKIKEFTFQKSNIVYELTEINNKNPKDLLPYDIARQSELKLTDDELKKNIEKCREDAKSYKILLNKIANSKKSAYGKLKTFIDDNKNKLSRKFESVAHIYESVFVDVVNKSDPNLKNQIYNYTVDVKTYPMIWKKFIKQSIKQSEKCDFDYTQVLDNISCYQSDIISFPDSMDNKLNKFILIGEYYEKVISPFVDNYFDLPKEYHGTNYSMDKIIDIIVHIVRRIICVNLFGTILKGLTNFIIMEFPYDPTNKSVNYATEDEYQQYIFNLIIDSINDRGDARVIKTDLDPSGTQMVGSRLLNYIFNTFPEKVVKIILQIFDGENEGENDPDKDNKIEYLFDHINVILESITAINLRPGNTLTSNFKMYVYPYFNDYLDLFVKEMYNLMTNYLRSLQYQSKMLTIFNKISLKADLEKAKCQAEL